MMFNHASGCRTQHCVMASHMPGHSADCCALQTAFGACYRGEGCETRNKSQIRSEVAHVHSLTVTTVK